MKALLSLLLVICLPGCETLNDPQILSTAMATGTSVLAGNMGSNSGTVSQLGYGLQRMFGQMNTTAVPRGRQVIYIDGTTGNVVNTSTEPGSPSGTPRVVYVTPTSAGYRPVQFNREAAYAGVPYPSDRDYLYQQ